ncbi:hypothetical protein SOVF_143910 [Spinacia oleracea]|nr:hypothetical protein SOVF_143910 [Spinacia oleracea]
MINIPNGKAEMPLTIETRQEAAYVHAIDDIESDKDEPWFTDIQRRVEVQHCKARHPESSRARCIFHRELIKCLGFAIHPSTWFFTIPSIFGTRSDSHTCFYILTSLPLSLASLASLPRIRPLSSRISSLMLVLRAVFTTVVTLKAACIVVRMSVAL